MSKTCPAKHTKFQPTDEQWRCPKCNATADDNFVIPDVLDGSDSDCGLLHEADEVYCYRCEYRTSGKAFANNLKKKLGLVKCPHCLGQGAVSPDKVSK